MGAGEVVNDELRIVLVDAEAVIHRLQPGDLIVITVPTDDPLMMDEFLAGLSEILERAGWLDQVSVLAVGPEVRIEILRLPTVSENDPVA